MRSQLIIIQMKYYKILLFVVVSGITASHHSYSQQSFNLPLLSNWDDDSIPPAWTGAYNSCWGYAANGMEYAFLASTQGTYFFDITDPANPVMVDFIKTKDTTTLVVNKDYDTYQNYLYAVSDQGENSLQIFDLQYLPDSVVLVYDSDAISKRCHTIAIENSRLYMCSNTRPDNSFGPMDVYSLADPVDPVFMGTVEDPGFYVVHEVFVRNDTAYCSNGFEGLWVYDLVNPATPSLITIINIYPEAGYNHSSWLTNDSKRIAFTDEVHGLGVKLMDITDLSNPVFLSMMRSNMLQVQDSLSTDGSVAHIPYIIGNTLLLSYYHDGVVAYNIADPLNPVKIAWHDTHPQNVDYYSYNGCWGLYPFLPSGNIIASDITNGLFILDGNNILNIQPEQPQSPSLSIGANPVHDQLNVYFNTPLNQDAAIEIFDITGKLIFNKQYTLTSGRNEINVPVEKLASGIYVANVESGNLKLTSKIIKLNRE